MIIITVVIILIITSIITISFYRSHYYLSFLLSTTTYYYQLLNIAKVLLLSITITYSTIHRYLSNVFFSKSPLDSSALRNSSALAASCRSGGSQGPPGRRATVNHAAAAEQ